MDQINFVYDSAISILENYGWYMLIASIVLVYIYQHSLKSIYEKYRQRKFEHEYAAKYHKNPDIVIAYKTAQERWVEKLEEKVKQSSQELLQKQKDKEERKKQELVEKYGDCTGKKLGNAASSSKNESTSLRTEYNPLMGSGSSSNYRPPKRSACGGGGCGR